ncbi:MAG: hypothetical protein AABX11_00635 [Nanoarchaeota archaeon]
MQKESKKRRLRFISLSQIFMLVLMTVSVSYFLSLQMGMVSAVEAWAAPAIASTPASSLSITAPATELELAVQEGIFGGAAPAAKPATLGSIVGDVASGGAKLGLTGTSGLVVGSLIQGLFWAGLVSLLVQYIGPMLGLDKKNVGALQTAAFIGGGAAVLAKIFVPEGGLSLGSMGTLSANTVFGITFVAVTVVAFLFLYSKEKTQTVTFTCLPWAPKLGGAECTKCNDNPETPCSEYRCKSLGQACDLVNKGTIEERCVWIARGDVTSPTITPWNEPLSDGLKYTPLPKDATRPTARGVAIYKQDGSCLDAFTKLTFGVLTNEPAQCKLDYAIKNYSQLQFYFGESNYFLYNHTQNMKLPSPNNSAVASPLFKNDGTMTLYLRCQDANGNTNDDAYAIEFCVDKAADTTAPLIESFTVESGKPVRYNIDNFTIGAETNEPAQCKWSRSDKPYDDMENTMSCSMDPTDINGNMNYPCTGSLTGIKNNVENKFYFRCKDEAGNMMTQGKELILLGSQPLNILEVKPNETITGSTNVVTVDIEVITDDGAEEGKATCYYNNSLTQDFIEMSETENYMHKQPLDLVSGNYTYNIKCIDAGGNVATKDTSFTVFSDTFAPRVTRVYKDQALKVVTDEDAQCYYSKQSCNYVLNEGLKMSYANANSADESYAPWEPGSTYYVKCVDEYGNMPAPNSCSVVVSPKGIGSMTGATTTNSSLL